MVRCLAGRFCLKVRLRLPVRKRQVLSILNWLHKLVRAGGQHQSLCQPLHLAIPRHERTNLACCSILQIRVLSRWSICAFVICARGHLRQSFCVGGADRSSCLCLPDRITGFTGRPIKPHVCRDVLPPEPHWPQPGLRRPPECQSDQPSAPYRKDVTSMLAGLRMAALDRLPSSTT